MHGLAPGVIRLANPLESPDPSNLPVRTLLRGARAHLPSGPEVAAALEEQGRLKSGDRLSNAELGRDTCDRTGSVLRKHRLEPNAPLFYYILKEAELKGRGVTLGPVGSHIVSDVIQSALEADPESYLSVWGAKWQPLRWQFPNGSLRPLNSLIGIVRLVGDEKLLPECEAHWRRYQVLPNALS
jgi:hypothetical protein